MFSHLLNCINSKSYFIVLLDFGRVVTYFSLSLDKLPRIYFGLLGSGSIGGFERDLMKQ